MVAALFHRVTCLFHEMCRANNLANINAIVAKYRGANVTQLWAQLAIKFLGVTTLVKDVPDSSRFIHLDSSSEAFCFILIYLDSS